MVSVARRNLFQEKARLLISVGGVAFALLLVLALDGLVAGSMAQITAYINNSGADVYVAQAGVRTMHMSSSALPLATAEEIRRVPGVAAVAPILYAANAVVAGDRRALAYVIGFDPAAKLGGPWRLAAGSAALERGEAILDASAATKLGVVVGDSVEIFGRSFRIRGLSGGTANFVNAIAFLRWDDFAALRAQPDTASYFLVGLENSVAPAEAARRIGAAVPDASVLSRAEFATEEAGVVRDMSAEIMVIMNAIGFLIGLAAVGLTIYTATLAKVREYGVLKALGAHNNWLYRLVVTQAFWSVAIGATVSVVLAVGLAAFIGAIVPDVSLRIEAPSVAKVFLAAGVIAVIGASLPVRQIARLDPVAVFRH